MPTPNAIFHRLSTPSSSTTSLPRGGVGRGPRVPLYVTGIVVGMC